MVQLKMYSRKKKRRLHGDEDELLRLTRTESLILLEIEATTTAGLTGCASSRSVSRTVGVTVGVTGRQESFGDGGSAGGVVGEGTLMPTIRSLS